MPDLAGSTLELLKWEYITMLTREDGSRLETSYRNELQAVVGQVIETAGRQWKVTAVTQPTGNGLGRIEATAYRSQGMG
jgi:hypothetical protein